MTTNYKSKPATWFWIVSIVALLWNLMGVWAYLSEAYFKDETMAVLSEAQKAIYESQPVWLTAAFAISVFAGTIGCVGLVLKKKWATPLFLVSLIAVLTRTLYYFFMTNATEVFDMVQGTILPIVIIIVAGLLYILSKIAKDRNWIS